MYEVQRPVTDKPNRITDLLYRVHTEITKEEKHLSFEILPIVYPQFAILQFDKCSNFFLWFHHFCSVAVC